ncbi:MAG: cation transporter [Clostridia bacterium]|nr:cation transporter [Clostridia bacterium]
MTDLLVRIFVKDYRRTDDPLVRARYGKLSGGVGIAMNLLLFSIKLFGALLVGSLAVRADAYNNLSDAASSIIALLTVLISCKPADRDHPFGHARIEYVSSMIVSFLIIIVGYDLARQSVEKIVGIVTGSAQARAYGEKEMTLVLVILAVSVLCKAFMFFFFRRLGKMIDSDIMRATAADSISDATATAAVLVSTLIFRFSGVDLDAYMGLAVAGFILWTGIKVLGETKNSILGEAPVKETVAGIEEIVRRYPQVLGIHDMMVHSYGPHHTVVSFHAEVDGKEDIFETHDVIDNIERAVSKELGIPCTIHMDPICVGDPVSDALKEQVSAVVKEIDERIRLHDFRCVIGQTHTNVIFDIDAPFEIKSSDEELREEIARSVKEKLGESVYAVVTVDRS